MLPWQHSHRSTNRGLMEKIILVFSICTWFKVNVSISLCFFLLCFCSQGHLRPRQETRSNTEEHSSVSSTTFLTMDDFVSLFSLINFTQNPYSIIKISSTCFHHPKFGSGNEKIPLKVIMNMKSPYRFSKCIFSFSMFLFIYLFYFFMFLTL